MHGTGAEGDPEAGACEPSGGRAEPGKPRPGAADWPAEVPTRHPPPTQGEARERRGERAARGGPSDGDPDSGGAPATPARPARAWPIEDEGFVPPAATGEPWRIPGVERLPEGEGRALLLERSDGGPIVELVLCRVDGVLHALDSSCPHAGGRIQGGPLVEGRYARCPLHWFDFEPATGRCVNADCDPARTFRVEERDGEALVFLAD